MSNKSEVNAQHVAYKITVHDLGKIVKGAVEREGMLAWQFNTVGVSDAITMGGEGKCHIPPLSPYTRRAHTTRNALLAADA